MILLIDNYDSFSYNLVQYLGELSEQVRVDRNDKIDLDTIISMQPQSIVLSPGPGNPNHAGICLSLIQHCYQQIPMFGVCLGMQAIAQAFGARIVRAKQVMHAKISHIYHQQGGVFKGIASPFPATRYHSLVIEPSTLSPDFEVTAWTDQDEIMGIRHKHHSLEGVQFHPESICTAHGHQLLRHFLDQHAKIHETII